MEKSENISNLTKALFVFDKEIATVKKDSTNPFYKNLYAALPDILSAIKDPLQKAGLTVKQFPENGCQLTTIVFHADSGEYISSTYEMKAVKDDPQQQGSRITYQRRYAIGAVLGLNIDVDDDGNKASQKDEKKETIPPTPTDNRPWLTDKMLGQAIEKIEKGDKEVYQKTIDAFRIGKIMKEKLDVAFNQLPF